MLSPNELYQTYTDNPCELINGRYEGAGTPYNLYELSTFLKQLEHPCIKNVSGYDSIKNSDWQDKLCLPYKYLEILDPHLFSEIQPDIKSGTAHAIRNAADVSRACDLISQGTDELYDTLLANDADKWIHRGATEYLTGFGGNKITHCLLMLGPNIVSSATAAARGTGCDEMDCLPPWKPGEGSALGALFSCKPKKDGLGKECSPCGVCPEDDPTGDHPCCGSSCAKRMNECCNDPPGDSEEFYYNNATLFNTNVFQLKRIKNKRTIKHLGYLVRKEYGGYANFQDVSENMWTCPPDLFLKYFQSNTNIDRVKTITYTNSVDDIKAALYNGYGVVLSSNVGFANVKDQRGLAYPDKIWYHSYAIVGYDDTKTQFNECVFIFANSWGDWIQGGDPSWAILPKGCFLVTESHLEAMLNLERIDKVGCREKPSLQQGVQITTPACTTDNSCIPWECGKNQKAMGMAFVLSFHGEFKVRKFDYKKFVIPNNKPNQAKELLSNSDSIKLYNGYDINTVPTPWDYLFENKNSKEYNFKDHIQYQQLFYDHENNESLFFHETSYSHQLSITSTTKKHSLNALNIDINNCTLSVDEINCRFIQCDNAIITANNTDYRNPRIRCEIFSCNKTEINVNIDAIVGGELIDSTHNAVIDGNIIAKNSIINNEAKINGNAYFHSSKNSGIVIRDAVFIEESINYGIVKGDAYFENCVNASGAIVEGNAVFFGEGSDNLGKVFGRSIYLERPPPQ